MELLFLALFAASLIACVVTGASVVFALVFGYILFFFYGLIHGKSVIDYAMLSALRFLMNLNPASVPLLKRLSLPAIQIIKMVSIFTQNQTNVIHRQLLNISANISVVRSSLPPGSTAMTEKWLLFITIAMKMTNA